MFVSAAPASGFDLPEDLREFVAEEIRSGRYATETDVLRDAVAALRHRQESVEVLRSALAAGIEDLDAGDYVEGTPAELVQALHSERLFEG